MVKKRNLIFLKTNFKKTLDKKTVSFSLGSCGHNILKLNFRLLLRIPDEIVLIWVKIVVPDSFVRINKTFNDLKTLEQWPNNLFVVIGSRCDSWFVINKSRNRFLLCLIPKNQKKYKLNLI